MQINLSKTASANIIDLINDANATALTSAEIAPGAPAAWTDPEGLNPRNTSMTVSAIAGSGYTGTVEVRYSRLDLASLAVDKTLSYTKSETSTLQTMMESIATQLGVVAESVKFDVDAVPTIPTDSESVTINLLGKTDSKLYIGTTPVTVYPVPSTDTQVDETVTTTDLDGFDEPA